MFIYFEHEPTKHIKLELSGQNIAPDERLIEKQMMLALIFSYPYLIFTYWEV